jgi:hypothetical protein
MLFRVLRAAPGLRTGPFPLTFTLLGWAFFLPTLVSTEELVGFWPYAMAHGAQYLIFMAVVSGNRKRSAVVLAVLVLISAAIYVRFGYLQRISEGRPRCIHRSRHEPLSRRYGRSTSRCSAFCFEIVSVLLSAN